MDVPNVIIPLGIKTVLASPSPLSNFFSGVFAKDIEPTVSSKAANKNFLIQIVYYEALRPCVHLSYGSYGLRNTALKVRLTGIPSPKRLQ